MEIRKWWLIALIGLAFGLRVYQLDAQSLWSDEGLTLYRSRLSIADNLTNIIVVPPGVPTRDTNPPLYFLAVSGLRLVAGESEYTLRFLSVLAGVVCVPLLYVLGRRLFSAGTGQVAALLGAISPFCVWYSQEARMYLLLAALSMASTYILLRALESPTWRLWLTWALVTGAAWYTHFTVAFLMAFQGGLILVWLMRLKRRAVFAAIGLLLALSVPLGGYAWSRAQEVGDPSFGLRSPGSIVEEVTSSFIVGRTNEIFQPLETALPGLILLALGVGWALREHRRSALVTLAYLLLPLLALAAASLLRPVYSGPRHVIVIAPPLYLLMAYGAAGLWQRQRLVGLIAIGLALIIMVNWLRVQFTDPAYRKDDLRALARQIAQQATAADVIIFHDAITSFVFDYYYSGVAPWRIIPAYPSRDVDAALVEFQAQAQAAQRVWFVDEPPPLGGFPQTVVDEWARGHLLRLDQARFPSIWMGADYQLYTAHFPIFAALPPSAQPRHLSWPATTLQLRGADPIVVDAARTTAQVTLYWRLDQPAPFNLIFTLRLVDDSGAEWGLQIGPAFDNWSAKQWPTDKLIQHTAALDLPQGLPDGRYRLLVKVVAKQTDTLLYASTGAEEVEALTVLVAP